MLARIRQLTCVVTGSAPLDHSLVNRLQEDGGTTVLDLYGATETLPLRQDYSQRHEYEWPYISFKVDSGVDFFHTMDDLYELIVDKDTGTDDTPSVFYTFPDQHTFRSRDLFTSHPQKPGLWRFLGRKDDMISLANGQSVHVGLLEGIIQECPDVEAAIVGEDGRPTTVVLIVPRKGASEDQGVIRKLQCALQPFIERANAKSPPAAHIHKDMVLILPCRDEIASVTDKGTLMRARLFQEFKKRIDQSYHAARRD